MTNQNETETWSFSVEINKDHTPATLSKIAKLTDISHIDGKIPPHEIKKAMSQHLEDYLKTTLGPYIEKPIFGSLVCGIGAPYLQVIESDNENAWCWDSIDFNGYNVFYELQEKGALKFLSEKLEKINKASYYLFCTKHGLDLGYSGYSGDHIGLSKEALTERILSDIDGEHDTIYREGFEDSYISDRYDSEIHKEEYLYTLLEEAREDYDDTHRYTEDRLEALNTVKNQWFTEYPENPLLTEIFNEIEKTIG